MNLHIRPTPIRFQAAAGESSLKAVVEGSLALPARFPPIRRIVRVSAVPRLDQWHAAAGEVSLEGTLDVSLLYAADAGAPEAWGHGDDGDGGYDDAADYGADDGLGIREELYRVLWRREIPYYGAVELPEADEGTEVVARVDVDDIRAAIGSGGRSLDVDAVLAASVRAVRTEEVEVPVFFGMTGDGTGVRLQREVLRVRTHGLRLQQVASVTGRLRLPSDAPPVRRPLDVGVVPTVEGVTVGDGWAEAAGSLDVHLAYAPAAEGMGPVQFVAWSGQLAFSHRFADGELSAGQRGTVRARVLSVDAEAGDEGRELEVFADIELTLETGEPLEVEVVADVTPGPGDEAVETRSESFTVQVTAGEGEQVRSVSGTLEIPPDAPPIERLLAHEARAVAAETLVLGDRVSVAGHVDVSLLYVGRGEEVDDPVHFVEWKAALPLELDISVPGVHPPMQAHVELEVLDIEPDLLNRETVEWRGRVRAAATVEESRPVDAIVEAVAVAPEEDDPPSYTFLVVQPGDTLWKLARRYRMAPEAVLAANPHLEGPETPLEAGSKVCIPRHRRQTLVPLNGLTHRNGA